MKKNAFLIIFAVLSIVCVCLASVIYFYNQNLNLMKENYVLKQNIELQKRLIKKQNDLIFWKDSLNHYLNQKR